MVTNVLQIFERTNELPITGTAYNGYRFKKRLEARWAVFFDTLSIPYRYEYEEFRLGNDITFAPSFFLPTLNSWAHIQDIEPDIVDDLKANLLALATQQNVYIFFGDCWKPDDLLQQGNQSGYGYFARDTDYGLDVFFEDKCWWCHCETCDAFGIAQNGSINLLPCKHYAQEITNISSFKLTSAYMKARQVRFENTNLVTIKLQDSIIADHPFDETTQQKNEDLTRDQQFKKVSQQPIEDDIIADLPFEKTSQLKIDNLATTVDQQQVEETAHQKTEDLAVPRNQQFEESPQQQIEAIIKDYQFEETLKQNNEEIAITEELTKTSVGLVQNGINTN